ncbi:MAG: hypothetical protein IPN86_04610 [Saprospiraceae bacterium]|jgi:hypothetical protein|nr:hypothetical protein [Saprospiraceae bacterium]
MYLVINGCSSKGTSYKLAPAREANPDGPNMSKQKLLDYVKEIEDELGKYFLPPTR